MRKLVLLTGLVALVLMAVASFRVCLHSIDHNEAADCKHHCLLCTGFGQTILGFSSVRFFAYHSEIG